MLAREFRSRRSSGPGRAAAGACLLAIVLLADGCAFATSSGSPQPTMALGLLATPTQATSSPSPASTPSAFDVPMVYLSPQPSLQLPPVVIAGNATVSAIRRTGTDKATNVHWDFTEPQVETPGSDAGARITADIETLLNGRLAYMEQWVGEIPAATRTPMPASPPVTNLTTTFVVVASAGPKTDPSAGFVTIRIDYVVDTNWIADAGPQWIDFLSYDFKTGQRISISGLFADTNTALQRLSVATAANTYIGQWSNPSEEPNPPDSTGYEPASANFAMWAPTPNGLEITFAASQVGPAVLGTPYVVVPWSQLNDLVMANSYLAWYLAGL